MDAIYQDILDNLTADVLTTDLAVYSPKIDMLVKHLNTTSGKIVLVYSNFKSLGGVGTIAKVLEHNGWSNLLDTNEGSSTLNKKKSGKGKETDIGRKFAVYSGETNDNDRMTIINTINSPENTKGELCSLLMITQAGAEGLDIKNIREVHILEQYWNKTRKSQVIGRAVRYKSHVMLPVAERTVDVYEYISVPIGTSSLKDNYDIVTKTFGKEETTTVDASLYYLSEHREHLLNSFKIAIREFAFDCSLNYTHNRDTIGTCRICAKTDKEMYYPSIKKHLLPNASNCIDKPPRASTEFEDVVILGNNYKYDPVKKLVYRVVVQNGKNLLYVDKKLTAVHLRFLETVKQ
jgi:hypothetical protein